MTKDEGKSEKQEAKSRKAVANDEKKGKGLGWHGQAFLLVRGKLRKRPTSEAGTRGASEGS